jgi:hypothetical protein
LTGQGGEKMFKLKKKLIPYLVIWLVLCSASVILYFVNPVVFLNENQILYLFSAASQVIAAIYGLLITGYIFLRNELDRKVTDDESYDEIITFLKKEYFSSIISISIVTILSIFFCFLVICFETYHKQTIVGIMINVSSSTIIIELVLIVAFVIEILNPESFEKASKKIKDKISINTPEEKGSLEDFLKYYNEIEYILEKYGIDKDRLFNKNEFYQKRTIAKSKLVYILFNEGKINEDLKNRLIELISLRNSLIHGSDLFVSINNVDSVNDALRQLKEAVDIG